MQGLENMARAQTVYLNSGDIPARKALQAALDQLGFKLVLDDSVEPLKTKGYLSCTLDREDAGFDLRFKKAEEDLYPGIKSELGSRDVAMSLRWAGDPREELAALAVCAALVGKFGAIAHEPEQDKLLSLDHLLARARKAAASL
jgi:hypothetical protein